MTSTGAVKSWGHRLAAGVAGLGAALALAGCQLDMSGLAPPALERGAAGQVVHVVDGDTADVQLVDGPQIRVRVLGIDTPETVKPNVPVQCWGPEASQWAHQTLDGAQVRLVPDPAADDVDKFGRSLRYMTLADGTDYSVLAAGEGMAREYPSYTKPLSKSADIVAAQTNAQSRQVGLWGPPCNGRSDN
ncbi:thermonuclease family protein [Rhodococcus erythropolis]|jgi:micrococcal nuclease|uniref:thermonuclease family protein n=1 Tax=Rhodococcus erythropolis TaxID=1833 RepID=UPI0022B37D58|nr:thermonuclease family protein [Rhodococcus erythropolis]MCZ4645129.1 thermonuclease family protein [Rhodococcus erythropolis]